MDLATRGQEVTTLGKSVDLSLSLPSFLLPLYAGIDYLLDTGMGETN